MILSVPRWQHSPPRWTHDPQYARGRKPRWCTHNKNKAKQDKSYKLFQREYRCFTSNHPLLNFLKGGLITLRLLITQWRPTLTLARSPLMIQSFITMVWRKRTFHIVNTQQGEITRRDKEENLSHFSIENNVLTAAKNRLSADFVAWCLERSKAQVTITWRSSSGLMYLKTPRANDTDVYWLASYDKLTLLCWRVIFV